MLRKTYKINCTAKSRKGAMRECYPHPHQYMLENSSYAGLEDLMNPFRMHKLLICVFKAEAHVCRTSESSLSREGVVNGLAGSRDLPKDFQ
jgi:hypothetical protein